MIQLNMRNRGKMIFKLRVNRRIHPIMCESSEGIRTNKGRRAKEYVGPEPIGKRTLGCLHCFLNMRNPGVRPSFNTNA
jgi:hypothetical protein